MLGTVSLDETQREALRRSVPPPRVEATPLREAVRSVAAALRSFPDRGMIIGGVALLAHGVASEPHGVEATMATTRDLAELFGELERFDLHARIDDALAYARALQELPLRHRTSGSDVDLSLAWRPFELDALAAAEDMLLGTLEVTVPRAEDLVIYKALSFGPQDQKDIERLVSLHGKTMDLARIRRVVADLVADEETRLGEVERAIERGLGLAP
jgi:hypothetical protein